MRTSIRAGAILGGVGSIALCVLQLQIALAIAPGVILAGALAGLAVAKWLDRAHYGRQLEEGLRAGLLASGLTAFVSLLALLVAGPHDVATLTARSRIFGLSLAPLVRRLSGLGWAEMDVLVLLVCCAAGLLLAAVLAQVFGWGKSTQAARSVRTARLTALALQRGEHWDTLPPAATIPALPSSFGARATGAPGMAAPPSGMMLPAASLLPSAFAAFAPGTAAANAPVASPAHTPLVPEPVQPVAPASKPRTLAASVPSGASGAPPRATEPALPPAPGEPAKRGARRKTSQARPVEGQLTREMRKALEDWAQREQQGGDPGDAHDAPTAAASRSGRTRQPSTFLNSAGSAPPKRNRKKNQTRDWLC
jgi:hypothetical protein